MSSQLVAAAAALGLPVATRDPGNGGPEPTRSLGAHDVAMVGPAPNVGYTPLAAGTPAVGSACAGRLAANVTSATGLRHPTSRVESRSTQTTRVARLRPGC